GRGPGSVRLPAVRLLVLPTITAADSNAQLRALHGPVAAPWWERIPWTLLVAGALATLAIVLIARRMRRRKPKVVPRPAPAPVPVRPRLAPAAEALRALAALRARGLPGLGQFDEHARELSGILRRFIEVNFSATRPGDTSGELLDHLRGSRVAADDFGRL